MWGSAVCNVAVEPPELPLHRFHSHYRLAARPVVIRNATQRTGARFRSLTTLEELVGGWGDRKVTLSSANAFSYGRRSMTIADYLSTMDRHDWDGQDSESADNIYYWFGEHGEELEDLLSQARAQLQTVGHLLAQALFARH